MGIAPSHGRLLHPSLRVTAEKKDQPDTLPVEIAQINEQWGSFRDVNEDILQAKIAQEQEQNGAPPSDEEAEETDLDTAERRDRLYKKRNEIIQFAAQSHTEAMFALDFVSLLLSKHAPRQAETSMSPFLKQVAPLGSLNGEVVNPPAKSEAALNDIATVSRGWRIQNFNSASSKLLDAASRLDSEVTAESRYWNEVLAVKAKGWKIAGCHKIVKHSEFSTASLEATPIFRDRGLASLRRSADGALLLDKGLIPAGSRFVRVRVKEGSNISSSSRPSEQNSSNPDSVEYQILQARDSVFEEELYHELVREARAMAPSGVTVRQDHIRVPASDDLEILLDLVDSNDESLGCGRNSSDSENLLADGLAHSIRILLAFAHRQNLHRRTQIPSPLTGKKRPNPEYPLLRPALAYFQHLSYVRRLESFLRDIYGVLHKAGLETPDFTISSFINESKNPGHPAPPTLEVLLQNSLSPVKSVFRGDLLSSGSSFEITVRTTLLAPPLGTAYKVTVNSPAPDFKSPGPLGLREEVEAAIIHILLLDVRPADEDQKATPAEGHFWEPVYPHLGELVLAGQPRKYKKMKVSLSRHELSLSVHRVRKFDALGHGGQEPESQPSRLHVWICNPSEGTTAESSLIDFVSSQTS
ncbi:hypothetical protein N7468_008747 [Penicillium chermesinum]|uniref:Mediator of RNA polymerase II transcription subunit 17 n=1 Tax=Penicillium chermesinum TaxID=63820 RepID=A0A9W9TED0_9EURO|nr:uncharacterized protein N7468_008747 [Penicillium chermesinum]KAJ5219543.1 hypothetical protein N7468_008747 [Penicillium chermesinum]